MFQAVVCLTVGDVSARWTPSPQQPGPSLAELQAAGMSADPDTCTAEGGPRNAEEESNCCGICVGRGGKDMKDCSGRVAPHTAKRLKFAVASRAVCSVMTMGGPASLWRCRFRPEQVRTRPVLVGAPQIVGHHESRLLIASISQL